MRTSRPDPSRRPRPPGRGWAGVVVGVALLALGCARSPAPPADNLVVIVIDTLRASHVGAYGYSRPTSPALDALAARGVLFRTAQSPSNWTVPSVGSLLTGAFPSQHGAHLGDGPRELGRAPEAPRSLSPSVPLLSEILTRAGFQTALWSGNPFLYGRFREGFGTVRAGRADGGEQIGEILDWVRANRERRFFLYWQIMDLHQPLDPPAELERRFAPDAPPDFPDEKTRDWDFGRLESDADRAFLRYRTLRTALYDATILHVDGLVGRLLEELRASGLQSSTLVVVTADHGEELWDHWREERALADDPRGIWGIGHGHSMYQELLHVPLLIAGPGARRGASSDCPVALTDVVPTVLARLGVPPAPHAAGLDLSGFLAGSARGCPQRPLLAEAPAYGPDSFALRMGHWKLVRRGDDLVQLYDLERDPGERTEVSALHPGLVTRLKGLAERLRAQASEVTPETVLDEKLREELRSLGYL